MVTVFSETLKSVDVNVTLHVSQRAVSAPVSSEGDRYQKKKALPRIRSVTGVLDLCPCSSL